MKYFIWLLLVGLAGSAHAAQPCAELASLRLEGGVITAARAVPAGQFTPSGTVPPAEADAYRKLPAFCRVEGRLHPSADSDIRIEVWLPATGWNGKLVESGNGSFAGSLSYSAMAQSLVAGYAATSSDGGHEGDSNSGAFILNHPEKLIDFGYRAVHVNALAAKAIVDAHYGRRAQKAYFYGCSTGGRQGYGEGQRYPADFDGIIAGAPGIHFTHQTGAELSIVRQVHNNPQSLIPPTKMQMFHTAVVAACDALDGVRDGVIESPLQCKFDPGRLLCKNGDAADCLTEPQVAIARTVYDGARFKDGKQIFPGLPPGTELDWGRMLIREVPLGYGLDAFRIVALQNPQWDFTTFDADRDIANADKSVGATMNNDDPNLKPYFSRGGKLLGFHGWGDSGNSPLNSISYYNDVAAALGGRQALANSYRLFLVPGMGHCGGGAEATNQFDLLAALDRWVLTGNAPDTIPASRLRDGKIDRTRPLCPYPQQAVYSGKGSTDVAASFSCQVK